MEKLSPNHHRVFSAIAYVVETKLLELQLCFYKYRIHRPVLLYLNDDMPEEKKNVIRNQINHLKELLRAFKEKYDLETETKSLRKEINTRASFLWEELAGSTGRRMEGYGHLDETIKAAFELEIERMTELVKQIIKETN